MTEDQQTALDALDNARRLTIRELYEELPLIRAKVEAAFSSEQIPLPAPVPPIAVHPVRHTHTYATLEVADTTFNDVCSRLIRSYPKGNPDVEHYFRRDQASRAVLEIVLGEVALIRIPPERKKV